MTIATDIIDGRMPDFNHYLRQGESLDDIDEYGFTPLIECAITKRLEIAQALISRGVDINKSDVTGRTPLHWAADYNDVDMVRLLLNHGANVNAYTRAGLSVLVYPLLRGQEPIKQLLYQYGAKLDFAQDFINAKLIGHRFELQGDVDIVNAEDEYIEFDYEGFILEFTVDVLQDSLRRFISSYATRHLRSYFPLLHDMLDAFFVSSQLLQLQRQPKLQPDDFNFLAQAAQAPLLILPAASRGHALGFVRYKNYWAKIDRGENSKREGCVNLYQIDYPERIDTVFLQNFLFKKQPRAFFHQTINQFLGLKRLGQVPVSPQITGNCSWANIQAMVPAAYTLMRYDDTQQLKTDEALFIYEAWLEWDQDRALDEAIQRFYHASAQRQASICSMLVAILFQSCDNRNPKHLIRAEKILKIALLPEYYFILESYLDAYCVKRLTQRGNNLLKILDDCGFNPNIGVSSIATE